MGVGAVVASAPILGSVSSEENTGEKVCEQHMPRPCGLGSSEVRAVSARGVLLDADRGPLRRCAALGEGGEVPERGREPEYRGTSLTRKFTLLELWRRHMSRVLGRS